MNERARKPVGAPIRIWYQLLSSESGMNRSLDATRAVSQRAAAANTSVEVRGTRHGALGDQFRIFWHYDVREVLNNGLAVRANAEYDAFVVANSLDPALIELREMLDIPVLSFMEVCCFTACTMGDRFGLVVPNERMIPHYASIVRGYGLASRLAAIEPLRFDNMRRFNDAFSDDAVGAELMEQVVQAGRRLADRGAEVIISCGPSAAFTALKGAFELDRVPLLDCYGLLVKSAEAMVAMHRLTGISVSRRLLYQTPPASLIQQCAEARDIDALRNG